MIEFIHDGTSVNRFQRSLFTSVSLLTLVGCSWAIPASASSSDAPDKPTVWIELGGQAERADSPQSIFAPQFFELSSPEDLKVMTDGQRPSRYNIGGEGRVSFSPAGTDWTFSAAVRYGRANSSRHLHHETPGLPPQLFTLGGNPFVQYTPAVRMFGDAQTTNQNTHLVVDFTAGKDVGLGLFGRNSTSVISAGIRFAQFTAKSDVTLHAAPIHYVTSQFNPGAFHLYYQHFRRYTAVLHADRNSHAFGPAVSWDASVPVAQSDNGNALLIDWGVNAAILFGRQRAAASHHTKGVEYGGLAGTYFLGSYAHSANPQLRSKAVTIPDVGGFAALSLKISDAKISIGYRADIYFNAMDVGIDTAHEQDQKFYGPFATISIGLGG